MKYVVVQSNPNAQFACVRTLNIVLRVIKKETEKKGKTFFPMMVRFVTIINEDLQRYI